MYIISKSVYLIKNRYIAFGCTVAVLFAILQLDSVAQFSGKITAESAEDHIVDMGMCLMGDSLQTSFLLQNTGTQTIKLGDVDPAYFLGLFNNFVDQFREFDVLGQKPPITLDSGQSHKLTIVYKAGTDDLIRYPAGKKYAMLILSLCDSRIISPGKSDLFVLDTFVLIARKTPHYIDGFENYYNFDSVYINPSQPVEWNWKVQNSTLNSIELESDSIQMLTPLPLEFTINGHTLPLEMYAKNQLIWKLGYQPKNTGTDSCIYKLSYHPKKLQFPDSVDYAVIKLAGTGVEQKLKIFESDATVSVDTIDVGDVPVGSSKTIFAVLQNDGNMHYGVKSQKILNPANEQVSNDYLIEKPLNESSNLRIGKTDTIKIKFVPDKLETILGKLVIESDIADRPIRAVPPEGRNKIIYLRGRGTGAEISVSRDTFKFGKVVLHLNNTAKKTLPLTIGNIGNDILIINKFETEPPFTVSPADVVFASEQKDFQITFETTKIGIYTKELKIISSSIAPSSTVTIVLTAESVLPLPENISFPSDIRAKPGRIISVPLLADKSNISTARIFSDTISFNETLLRYNGFDKTNTASEAASYSEILINETSDKGRVAINITMPNNVFFAESDTLILLNFKTYLGNNLSTPIAFANPQFSDGYFLNVLTPVFRNGYFTLDSVCGLVYKLQPGGSNIFKFDECYPNPATDYIDMDFEIPFTVNVDIKILNTNGEFVKSGLESTLQAGKYKFTLPVRELSPGIYYCVIRCGLFSRVRKIIVTR